MLELDDLAAEIFMALVEQGERDAFWCVQPEMMEEYWQILPPPLRFEVEYPVAQMRKLMPPDFGIFLEFDVEGAHFWAEETNGCTYGFNEDDAYFSREELFAVLREAKWDEIRAMKPEKRL